MRRFVLLCLLAGCVQAPSPLAEPPHPIAVHHLRAPWFGDLFTGDGPGAVEAACMLQVNTFAVREDLAGIPVQDAATVIAATSGTPFRGASTILRQLRFVHGGDADAWCDAAGGRDATRLQATGSATAAVASGLCTTMAGSAGTIDLLATMHAGSLRLALRDAEEILVLAPGLAAAGSRIVLFAPSRDPAGPWHALALERVEPVEPQALAAATAAADADAAQRAEPAVDRSTERQIELAKQAVGERNRRPALLGLAQRLQAPRVVDLLLCADEAALRAITAGLPAAVATGAGGWPFEQHVWSALLPQLQRDELTPGLRSSVLRQLGSLVYDPATLGTLLQVCRSEAEFFTAVREENLLALADHDAAPRVRAHEWLAGNGGSVPGFDPLAPTDERQTVLRAFHATEAAKLAAARAQEAGR